MKKHSSPPVVVIVFFALLIIVPLSAIRAQQKVKFAMVGLSHGHSPWFFEWGQREDMELVGIYEKNPEIVARFKQRYGLDDSLFYSGLEEMLEERQPDGVLVFGPIFYHLEAVQAAAPRGIHVMVEKPLSSNLVDAEKMAALAKKHKIHLLTNYETSWYPSTEKTIRFFEQEKALFGPIRKMVFHHGHEGPKEIGVGKEFLDWLTDPKLNGGGALVDFGCYGANIMTFLMQGEKPVSVTAITKNYKPESYSKVDDEATIIVDYGDAQGIIQASWNWPFGRKDMEVYGTKGYVITKDDQQMRYRVKGEEEVKIQANKEELQSVSNPFEYFKGVILGEIDLQPFSLYTLDNNLRVMEILEAAKLSAESGRKVVLE